MKKNNGAKNTARGSWFKIKEVVADTMLHRQPILSAAAVPQLRVGHPPVETGNPAVLVPTITPYHASYVGVVGALDYE